MEEFRPHDGTVCGDERHAFPGDVQTGGSETATLGCKSTLCPRVLAFPFWSLELRLPYCEQQPIDCIQKKLRSSDVETHTRSWLLETVGPCLSTIVDGILDRHCSVELTWIFFSTFEEPHFKSCWEVLRVLAMILDTEQTGIANSVKKRTLIESLWYAKSVLVVYKMYIFL